MPYTPSPSPEWVMVGIRISPDRVRLLASQEMDEVELRSERLDLRPLFDRQDPFGMDSSADYFARTKYYVTATMRTYIVVEADDYPAAFRTLFAQWAPTRPVTPEIENQPQIES